ncbi:MAG: hypothetical protein A2231_11350 [Candidatus Firestonebacteria bacterium RIFOXYA2_FULL_40_8]|nr:MAG: hypothetical protein A2231_11350 [Candidatus Firestonebacteria bacterium RIFOXYA2_FULL_40_8]
MKRVMLNLIVCLCMLGLLGCGSKYESLKKDYEKNVARWEELISVLHSRELTSQEAEERKRLLQSLPKDIEDLKEIAFKEKQLDEYEKIWGPKMLKRLSVENNERDLLNHYKGELAMLNSALLIYFGNNEGLGYPEKLDALIEKKLLDKIPVEPFSNLNKVSYTFDGTGGWYYNQKGDKSETLSVVLHANLKGSVACYPYSKISAIRIVD